MDKALEDVRLERVRQFGLIFHGLFTEDLDKKNTQKDWMRYIASYNGVASPQGAFRRDMVKIAALAVAAIEAHDKGHC